MATGWNRSARRDKSNLVLFCVVVSPMSDAALREEMQQLRDKVARLEAARAEPVEVKVEGFEGLRQLSHAIETQQMDAFMLQNAVPDRVFWGWFWALIICTGVFFAALLIDHFFF